MADGNTKTSGDEYPEKSAENSEDNKSADKNSTGQNQPSDDFRETLLKSCLDISGFQIGEPEKNSLPADKPLAVSSLDFSEEQKNSTEKTSPQMPLEISKINKKVLPKFRRWHQAAAAAGIAAVIVLQSVFQFSFIQDEKLRTFENLTEIALPAEQTVEETAQAKISEAKILETKPKPKIETKTEYRNAKVPVQPKKAAPQMLREIQPVPVRTAVRKKEQRESNAKRLRRVEQILTGI